MITFDRLLRTCAAGALLAACAQFASASVQLPTNPTPEPGTILLMGGGLSALGLISWRKNRKR